MSAQVAPAAKAEQKRLYMAEYYQRNKERLKAEQRERWHANIEKNKATAAKYRDANRERIREKSRQYHHDNRFTYWVKSLERKFGISYFDYQALSDQQGGVCAICKQPEKQRDYRTGKTRRLPVDHDHTTGKVRGLLCHRCNLVVGLIEERPDIVDNIRAYLDTHRSA